MDAANQTLATKLWISYLTAPGNDARVMLLSLRPADRIIVQDKDDATRWQEYLADGNPVDHGTWMEIAVDWQDGGTPLPAQRVLVIVRSAGIPGPPGPSGADGADGADGAPGLPGTPGADGLPHDVADEGTVLPRRGVLTFAGAGVIATDDAGNGRTVVTIPGVDLMDEGALLTRRPVINFVGPGVTVTDDPANNRTIVTITGTGGGGTLVDIAPHNMTANNAPTPYVASASREYIGQFPAWLAFESNAGTLQYWLGNGNGVDWLQLDVGAANAAVLHSYGVKVNTVPEPTRAPKNWTMLGSTDGVSFTTLHTVTNQINWASGEKRTYICDISSSVSYRYFRLNITANNGDASFTQVAELYLYKQTA